MDIAELLYHTEQVGKSLKVYQKHGENRYSPSYTFSHKPFGQVYLNNMVVSFKVDERIIEIILLMDTVTDSLKEIHRLALVLKNVNFEPYTIMSLCALIRSEDSAFENISNQEIIDIILNDRIQPLKGRTILQKSSTDRKFLVIDNKISHTNIDIACRCSCSSFFYSFAWYNADYSCLIGKRPPAYQRKNINPDGSFITVRNPVQRPGVCKHLMLLIGLLSQGGLIQEIPNLTPYVPKIGGDSIIQSYAGELGVFTGRLKPISRTRVDGLMRRLKDTMRKLGQTRKGFYW